MQRLQRQPADLAFGVRPDGWKILACRELCTERRSGVSRRDSPSRLTPERREGVLDTVEQEFFDSAQLRLIR